MRNLKYLGFFFLLPLVLGMQPGQDDTTEMNIKFAAGRGSYAHITRGCEGVTSKQDIPYKDIGVSFDYKLKPTVQAGLRAGTIWEEYEYAVYANGIEFKEETNSYLNPNISLGGRWIGIGVGPFWAKRHLPHREDRNWVKNSVSWHLRVGRPKLYFSIHMLENVPLYSGGGYINLGMGGKAGRKTNYWLGLGTPGPYDATGLVAKANFNLRKNWYLDLAGRLNISEQEHGISVGLNYKL
jgi:hypothetical protein